MTDKIPFSSDSQAPPVKPGPGHLLRRLSFFTLTMPSLPPPPPTTAPSTVHNPPPPPKLLPWYFYTSPHPLDDPLSPLPPIVATTTPTKYPPRPFSALDSHALELAYQDLLQDRQAAGAKANRPRTASLQNRPVQTPSKLKDKRRSVEFSPAPRQSKDRQPVELSEQGTIPDAVAIPTPNLRLRQDERTTSLPDSQMYPRRQQEPDPSPPKTPSSITSAQSSYNPAGTTSNPFIRAPSHRRSKRQTTPPPRARSRSKAPASPAPSVSRSVQPHKKIAVGVQRLHQVILPALTLEPIYWSPLHGLDNAGVIRGTWFYRDTMLPVETEKANALEKGWTELGAWTQEWSWELDAAVRIGEEAEIKVRWPLPSSTLIASEPTNDGTSNTKKRSSMMEEGSNFNAEEIFVDSDQLDPEESAREASGEWVIFANPTEAYILRDSLLSGFAGINKRPLAAIKRGKTVGIPVVRGFDEKAWRKIHSKAEKTNSQRGKGKISEGVREDEEGREKRQQITDLVLIVHGIGQKLSERVESFNFTHAVNSFRRHINVELRDPLVKPHLRNKDVGIMVLPINWRSKLKFDSDSPAAGDDDDDLAFTLSDITVPTIPAVRNIIGDVMLDIPYYLSHHKQTMVNAVIKEANRVYRLWCYNNPTFLSSGGKVHLIAHSLGTAIAMDILSMQPTYVPSGPVRKQRLHGSEKGDVSGGETEEDESHFEFDTSNLFCAGSPAGFFLLLNRSGLLPRSGRGKLLDDGNPWSVTGHQGTYGCIAVDNIYNVLHYSDPIAYRLNPTVDAEYANSLKRAHVPSTAQTFLSSLAYYLPGVSPAPISATKAEQQRPVNQTQRLPSTIELETHDFSREEVAEKRMNLLNDNGQIDWFLRAGGPLENAYLNMLGAHSSYWESRDFVRFLVMELGRVRGPAGVMEGMKAQKRRGLANIVRK